MTLFCYIYIHIYCIYVYIQMKYFLDSSVMKDFLCFSCFLFPNMPYKI